MERRAEDTQKGLEPQRCRKTFRGSELLGLGTRARSIQAESSTIPRERDDDCDFRDSSLP